MSAIQIITLLGAFSVVPSNSAISVSGCRFGETYSFNDSTCQLVIRNPTNESVTFEVSPESREDTAYPAKGIVKAGSELALTAMVNGRNLNGEISKKFDIKISDRKQSPIAQFVATASGFYMNVLDNPFSNIDFGSVDVSSVKLEKSLKLASNESNELKFMGISSSLPGVVANISQDGSTLTAALSNDTPWGVLDGYIKTRISSEKQHEAWIRVRGNVHGDVSPKGNPAWLGFSTADEMGKVLIPLTSSSGKAFTVGATKLIGLAGTISRSPCEPPSAACRALSYTPSNEQVGGTIKGQLVIQLPDYSRELTLNLLGVLQKPAAPGSTSSKQPIQSESATAANQNVEIPVHSASALSDAKSAPQGSGPLLKWSVKNDSGVYGYQVFRSTNESGPFALQNEKSIPAERQQHDGGNFYQWRDNTARRGSIYWYYVGAIGRDGSKRKLSKPQKKIF